MLGDSSKNGHAQDVVFGEIRVNELAAHEDGAEDNEDLDVQSSDVLLRDVSVLESW